MAALPPPGAFGLPSKFTSWRPNQSEAIVRGLDSPQRFVVPVCPTGFGKSLLYMTMAVLKGGRTLILTSTKGLQTQLLEDFKDMGAVDIRGRNAYLCPLEHDGTTCDHGACVADIECDRKLKGGCPYYDQLRLAKVAPIVITNYTYWMYQNVHGGGLGVDFTTVVCDEAHNTPDHVTSFLTVVMDRSEEVIKSVLPTDPSKLTFTEWRKWASEKKPVIGEELRIMHKLVKDGFTDRVLRKRISRLMMLKKNLDYVIEADLGTWVSDVSRYAVTFAPIWPAKDCEEVLFGGVKRVVLTSASICSKTLEVLGIEESVCEFMEYPHSFPVENRLLTHIPTVRMNYRATPMELRQWVTRIDQIIRGRQDRKGIIHTVSYKRRDMVMANSEFSDIMLTHESRNTEAMVERFKAAKPPAVLVSPSMSTGWDFPYDAAKYQIIGKLGYPNTKDTIVAARAKQDKDYTSYMAMQQLVQAAGRGVRAVDDMCETLVIDDNIIWFMQRYKEFAPQWFRDAYVRRRTIPQAPAL